MTVKLFRKLELNRASFKLQVHVDVVFSVRKKLFVSDWIYWCGLLSELLSQS